jgi:hypothetical protein
MTQYGRRYWGIILSVLLFSMFSISSFAQANYFEQIGPPATDTTVPVELGFVDLSNGNLHLEVPIANSPQRGSLQYSAKLVYDSRIWMSGAFYPTMLQSFRPINIGDGHGNYALGGWRLVVTTDATKMELFMRRPEGCVAIMIFSPTARTAILPVSRGRVRRE